MGLREARRLRLLDPPVARLLEVAPVIYSAMGWRAGAAADLGVTEADPAVWLGGAQPGSGWLPGFPTLNRGLRFVRNRHEWLALRAVGLLKILGSHDDSAGQQPESQMSPEGACRFGPKSNILSTK